MAGLMTGNFRTTDFLTITPALKMPEYLFLHVSLQAQSAEAEFKTFSGLGRSNRDRFNPR
jgi:hypothetical protein